MNKQDLTAADTGVDAQTCKLSVLDKRIASKTEFKQIIGRGARIVVQHQVRAIIANPPLTKQRRTVAKVEQLMALVDALETQLAASRATAANLLSALVAELTH